MAEHNETGKRGEEIAADYLLSKGYIILETNWRYKNLEADIIATIDNTLVVAEVKTRKTNYFGEPETFVNKQKQKNLK
jgi:putative endonuclease